MSPDIERERDNMVRKYLEMGAWLDRPFGKPPTSQQLAQVERLRDELTRDLAKLLGIEVAAARAILNESRTLIDPSASPTTSNYAKGG